MIDSRISPTVAMCDHPNCGESYSNSENKPLVPFQKELAQYRWFWNVVYDEVHTFCPTHRAYGENLAEG